MHSDNNHTVANSENETIPTAVDALRTLVIEQQEKLVHILAHSDH